MFQKHFKSIFSKMEKKYRSKIATSLCRWNNDAIIIQIKIYIVFFFFKNKSIIDLKYSLCKWKKDTISTVFLFEVLNTMKFSMKAYNNFCLNSRLLLVKT